MMARRDPYDIQQIFEDMALALITSMKRNFQRHIREEMKEGFRWDRWQFVLLRSLNRFRGQNSRIIQSAFREAERLTESVLRESFEIGQRAAEQQIRQVMVGDRIAAAEVSGEVRLPIDEKPPPVTKGQKRPKISYSQLPRAAPETQFFGMNERKLTALQQSVVSDLMQAEYGVLRKMDDVYRQVIYRAQANMTAGAKTLRQAVDMAAKEFLERGIDSVTYKDGRKVNIASWAEMALRTASQRATFLGEGQKRAEWGIYTVLMSAHDNCSPWCLPYQGTVLIDDVYTSISPEQAEEQSKEYGAPLLSEAMRNGAFHPNCRHTLTTFFPGITQVPPPVDDAKAERMYRAEQHQRYIERNIRKYKRLVAGSLDEQNVQRYKRKLMEWEARMEELLEAYPQLRRNRAREVDRTMVV